MRAARWIVQAAVPVVVVSACCAQVPPSLAVMAANEVAARQHPSEFAYTAEERSDRTGMHLWREHVVEIGDGVLRRLVAVDGHPLSAADTAVETERLQKLVRDPDEFRRLSAAHRDDEKHAAAMLQLIPRAYLITPDGNDGNCVRYKFAPNPAFQPATYEERVGAAMAGTVSVAEPASRLCLLQGTLQHTVTFGFGLIGKVDAGGSFKLERVPVSSTEWKSRVISVHMGGKILAYGREDPDDEVAGEGAGGGAQRDPRGCAGPYAGAGHGIDRAVTHCFGVACGFIVRGSSNSYSPDLHCRYPLPWEWLPSLRDPKRGVLCVAGCDVLLPLF